METPGIYYTEDARKTWQRAGADGLQGKVVALAVHPSDPRRIAVATDRGVFLSNEGRIDVCADRAK